jgi:hypothetical protein
MNAREGDEAGQETKTTNLFLSGCSLLFSCWIFLWQPSSQIWEGKQVNKHKERIHLVLSHQNKQNKTDTQNKEKERKHDSEKTATNKRDNLKLENES